MTTSRFCSLCGQPLQGMGAVIEQQSGGERGLAVCANCLRSTLRCPACRAPLGDSQAAVCPTCGAELMHCLTCGQVITGRYVKIGERGPFCERCYQTRPACAVCGSPAAGGSRALPDGRHICVICHQTAIYDENVARSLFNQVKIVVGHELGLALNIPTPVYLADRNQLKAVAARLDQITEPMPLDQSLGFYIRQGRRRGIYALLGLPQTLLMGVLAHEYAHAWQAEHNPLGGELLLWEGFAEWVAYKTMAHSGHTAVMHQMQSQPNIYGQGLRWMLQIERANGIAGVLKVARKGRRAAK